MFRISIHIVVVSLGLTLLATSFGSHELGAQVALESRTPIEGLVIGGRVNVQLNSTSVEEEVDWQWEIRRARLYVHAQVNDWIDGVAQIDWSGQNAEGRLLFVRGTIRPDFQVTVGQFKRAFDLFELTSSSQILVVERAGRVRGLDACAGVGGICTYSRFTEALDHSSLDLGLLVDGVLLDERATYSVSLTNGAGRNRGDENDGKSMAARVAYEARPNLLLGVNLGIHDYPNAVTGRDAHAPALAVDVEWGTYDSGPHVQAGLLFGENWKNLDGGGDGSDFVAVQGIVTYRTAVSPNRYVEALEPVFRMSFGDPDRDRGRDHGWLLTPGLVAHFDGRNKVAANVDVWSPSSGPSAWGLLLQTYFYF